jgi:hypothetical protein
MTNTYDHLYESFGSELVNDAIEFAKFTASQYKPSYFTTLEDFEPHIWVVAALCALHKAATDA